MKNYTRILSILFLALLTFVMSATAQTNDNKNKAIVETTDGTQQLNTDEISIIRFDGDKVTFVQPWGESVFDRTLRSLTFLRPLPGTLRLTVNAGINENSSNRAQAIDGEGKLKSTWASGDVVYVYADATSTTSIGTLTPSSYGSNSATLTGDIDATGLVNNQTLYFSTKPRPFNFTSQDGTVESLFYFTTSAAVTVEGGNASLTGDLNFTRPVAIVKFALMDKGNGNAAINADKLVVTVDGNSYTVTPASATDKLFVGIPSFSSKTVYLMANQGSSVYIYEKASVSFAVNGYYAINVKMKSAIVDLGSLTENYVAKNNEILTGTLGDTYKISIADGATVTLDNANINNGWAWYTCGFAGITCLGDATIILKGGTTNTVVSMDYRHPGIYVPEGKTLTTQGTGRLKVYAKDKDYSASGGAAIGGGQNLSCGNIVINGGLIEANAISNAAGIGSGYAQSAAVTCGTITINGGTVKANGGEYGAGIGTGKAEGGTNSCGAININGGMVEAKGGQHGAGIGSGYQSSSNANTCASITVASNVTSVVGKKSGSDPDWAHSISRGWNSSCGTVTIGGTVYWDGTSYQNDGDAYLSDNSCEYPASADETIATKSGSGARVFNGTNVTISCSQVNDGSGAQIGYNNTITISAKNGKTITKVEFECAYTDWYSAGNTTVTQGIRDWEQWATTGYINLVNSTSVTMSNTYSGDVIITQVKVYYTPADKIVDLSTLSGDYEAKNGDILTGELDVANYPVKISIADGATVTLDGATINGVSDGASDASNSTVPWAGITCLGDATIILSGTNIVKGFYEDYPGIHVPSGSTLTIQGSTGSLNASSNGYGAGIGGGYGIACGNIEIQGGVITATGGAGNAAGIGGGGNSASCGTITISGGNITANGGENRAAGIGTGANGTCGNITINGGSITANGGEKGAGIGTGIGGTCGTITIYNTVTSVTATKGSVAPNSIGAGDNGTCGTVTIGGAVYWNGSTYENGGDTYLTQGTLVYPALVNLAALTSNYVARDGDILTGELDVANYPVKISIASGATVTLDNATINGVHDSDYEWAGITCLGNATIILEGTNTVKGFNKYYPGIQAAHNGTGVGDEYTLTIQGTGSLTASSNGRATGIGAANDYECGNITISGGTITATGGDNTAGIGGSHYGNCGNITINGGTITATGGDDAAGIGSGTGTTCGSITISGGTISATGRSGGAGIGSGNDWASCGAITITSGVTRVTATKGSSAPNSIGAGAANSTCGTVTIGGVVGAITENPYTYPSPLLSGQFTINGSGDKVQFSRGNLQAVCASSDADGSTLETWTWQFASNQNEFVGNAAANNAINGIGSVSTAGIVDLFSWSTGTTYYGIYDFNSNDLFSGDFVDWGGNIGSGWRTLTQAEWNYLFSGRTNASNLFGHGCIDGVNGMIILPDTWTLPDGLGFSAGKNYYSTNSYTTAQWSQMESAGAVFLPAASYREPGYGIYDDEEDGNYWSSTPSGAFKACQIGFSSYGLYIEDITNGRCAGMSVRLVKDAN